MPETQRAPESGLRGAAECSSERIEQTPNRPPAGVRQEVSRKPRLKIRIPGDDLFSARTLTLTGRQAWCLDRLHRAGRNGCTTLRDPAPRWSDYVFKLRGQGIVIATEHEPHSGQYPGHHARYRLATAIEVLEREGLEP